MIVEPKENPSHTRLHFFNQHLENSENMLRRIEAYSLKLNNHIRSIKKLVATNQSLIAQLQDNGKCMNVLLDDKAQGNGIFELGNTSTFDEMERLRSSKRKCQLRRTCKVTNIKEITCAPCKSRILPQKEQIQDMEQDYYSHTSVNISSIDWVRLKGGQELSNSFTSFSDLSEEIAFKVKCILKLVEKLDFKTAKISDVKAISRRVLSAMIKRQQNCCKHKVVSSTLALIPGNPYLSD